MTLRRLRRMGNPRQILGRLCRLRSFPEVFDGLARTFRSLTLPLPITRVTLLPPCLSDLPTPRPRPCDSPVTSLKVHIAFERSGKWPDSLPALMKLKPAFYLAIMKQLSHKPKSEVQHFRAFSDHLLVAKDGFVFRVTAVPPNEVALRQRTVVLPGGVIHRYPTASSKAYHRETVLIPRIASALERSVTENKAAIQTEAAGLSLVDHWLSSQFLSPPFSPPLFSLLYASLFLRPSHKEGAVNHPPPGSPPAAFFRFLHLLQATDFHQTPIILNFNDELTEDGVLDLEAALLTKMTSGRTSLPPIVLATPWDTSGDVWSRSGAGGPSKMMLNRAQAVSRAAVRSLAAVPPSTKRTLALFRADLSPYDLVLHVGLTTLCSSAMRELQRQHISQFPFLVDVDPAEELFDFLKATLVDVAMVLRRSRATFTGKSSSSESYVIAIMWRPDAFTRRFPYNSKTSTLRPGFILEELDGKWSTRLSRDAILTWIQTFGKGLIQHTAVKEK
ncbi:unnamed protein product [Cyprideis torosa]|uniref:Nucleolar protein 6 n=1 Tax=Cyprideis torosa TaxID=163714 RepID=A0A7R8ZQ20_9CRUS|nr:unnamed protein product [Cyprideis torosa]CAG0891126.1 unnamed protein product [Cyprideis torosa]